MKNLVKAVIAVQSAVRGMEKNSKVGSGNHSYDGTKDEDVKEVFNKQMSENGLIILPISIDDETQVDRWVDNYGKPKQSVFTKVRTKYMLLHTSGESIELAGYGHGVDSQDKGAGKATTYALKNTLLNMFLTPVGKKPDTDTTHSDDIPVPVKAKPAYDKKNYSKAAKAIKEGKATILEMRKHYTVTKAAEAEIKALIKKMK